MDWYGGKDIEDFYDSVTEPREDIRTGDFDYVVLQAYNSAQDHPQGAEEIFKEYVRKFDTLIINAGAQTILYMHWPPSPEASWMSRGAYDYVAKELDTNYTQIGREIGAAAVVPCGRIIHDLTVDPPEDRYPAYGTWLYQDDDGVTGVHQNGLAMGVNALAFYTMLTHRSPVGLHYTHGDYDLSSDPALERAIEERVWEVISTRESWGATATAPAASAMRVAAPPARARTVLRIPGLTDQLPGAFTSLAGRDCAVGIPCMGLYLHVARD
jgi:hypothetical protein